ncbi:hypothetical protein PR048_007427 [Dryococelus australis]|uniref:Uncharacterized protein n=1 Tax=Dryococelus australis TaxID=614101 RepID=A0ABQ9HU82_9NEOP|nr:hypothetical protein PR048_007427 [Dryococelus australis]
MSLSPCNISPALSQDMEVRRPRQFQLQRLGQCSQWLGSGVSYRTLADRRMSECLLPICDCSLLGDVGCQDRLHCLIHVCAQSVDSLAAAVSSTSPTCLVSLKEIGHSLTELILLAQEFSEASQTYFRPMTGVGHTRTEWLARSPPTNSNRVQYPTGSPDSCQWELCRTMPLVAGISRGPPSSPPLHSGATPYSLQSPSSALKTLLLRAAQISSLIFIFMGSKVRFWFYQRRVFVSVVFVHTWGRVAGRGAGSWETARRLRDVACQGTRLAAGRGPQGTCSVGPRGKYSWGHRSSTLTWAPPRVARAAATTASCGSTSSEVSVLAARSPSGWNRRSCYSNPLSESSQTPSCLPLSSQHALPSRDWLFPTVTGNHRQPHVPLLTKTRRFRCSFLPPAGRTDSLSCVFSGEVSHQDKQRSRRPVRYGRLTDLQRSLSPVEERTRQGCNGRQQASSKTTPQVHYQVQGGGGNALSAWRGLKGRPADPLQQGHNGAPRVRRVVEGGTSWHVPPPPPANAHIEQAAAPFPLLLCVWMRARAGYCPSCKHSPASCDGCCPSRNDGAGETGDPRENRPSCGIVRHDCEPGSSWWRREQSNHYTTVAAGELSLHSMPYLTLNQV